MVSGPPKDTVKGENALYIFNRLLRMATETELSTWKQNQVRSFMKHDQIDEILTLSDGFGRTILDNACSAGNLRLVQLLHPMGAKMGKPQVTMSIVCSEEHLAVLDYLLSHDPSICTTEVVMGNGEDESERMPLLNFCAKKGDERILPILFSYGFKTPESVRDSVDLAGNTPLHLVRKEKLAALILNRSGLDILRTTNRRGQLPIDCLLERYGAIKSTNNGFAGPFAGYEEELKKTIAFLNTLMNHAPAANKPPRAVTPPALPLVGSMGRSVSDTASMLRRQSSNSTYRSLGSASPKAQLRLPPREVPKSFLSRELFSGAVARNRLLQEQQELIEVAALRRQKMLEEEQQLLVLKGGNNRFAFLEAARAAQHPPPTSAVSSALRLPLTSTSNGAPSSPLSYHRKYVAAIDAAFASENNSSGMSPSLSLLANALTNHKNSPHQQQPNFFPRTNKNSMLSGLSSQEEFRLRAAAANAKSLYPSRFAEDNELHKLLRAKYC